MPRKTCVEVLLAGRCRKEAMEGSDRCIFHDPEVWKHKPELIRKKLIEQIQRKNYDFEGYNFPEINFAEIIKGRQFKESPNFRRAHFHAETVFCDFQFELYANFVEAKFSGHANFIGARFLGSADFTHARFSGYADFRDAEFSGHPVFRDAEFLGSADFIGARFLAYADFTHARFSGYAGFTHARFSFDAVFNNAKFSGSVYFIRVTFSGHVSLLGVAVGDVSFDFSFSVFRRELFVDEIQWSRKNYRLKIENTDLERAIRNYHLLKKVFLAMGHYRVVGDLYYNEMACRRELLSKSLKKSLPSLSDTAKSVCDMPPLKDVVKSPFLRRIKEMGVVEEVLSRIFRRDTSNRHSRLKGSFWKQFFDWAWMQILYLTCGFGERPLRVVGLSLATIFIFTLAYCLLIPTSILTAFYLSCDCFVTLGIFKSEMVAIKYQWLTYLEAGLGLFMMSLFLVVFSRKMTRD